MKRYPRKVPYICKDQLEDYVEHALPRLRAFYQKVWKSNCHQIEKEQVRMSTRRKASAKPSFKKEPTSSKELFECLVVAIENARIFLNLQGCTQLPQAFSHAGPYTEIAAYAYEFKINISEVENHLSF